jgi:hypothetical protein
VQAGALRDGLAALNAKVQSAHAPATRFAALDDSAQIAMLKAEEKSPFFGQVRFLTLAGMFALPSYGGNRETSAGAVGFDHRHGATLRYYDARGRVQWATRMLVLAARAGRFVTGSGAAGGVIAKGLRPRVQCRRPRAGPYRKAADFVHDELGVFFNQALMGGWKESTRRPSVRTEEAKVQDFPPPPSIARRRGSSALRATSALSSQRLQGAQYVGAVADAALADWPVSYDELEPYYTRVDREIGVRHAGPVRSTALETPSAAADAGSRPGFCRAWCAEARSACTARAGGDPVAVAERTRRVRALRFCIGSAARPARILDAGRDIRCRGEWSLRAAYRVHGFPHRHR